MQSGERSRRRAAVGSQWLLALGIAGSALAVGTVHTITLCVVTVVLAAAAVLGWWGAEPMRVRTPATVLLVTGVGLTLYTALQCVPMPIGWLAAIAPHNADVWSRALSPLHEAGPSWAPISLDPIATRVEVLKGVAYLLAFVTALRVARRREGVTFLGAVIVLTAVALAVTALLHPAFGAKKLFGIYEPGVAIAERHIAPLMNPNQLAAYLNIGLCLALASALAPEPRVPRVIAIAVALVLAAVQVWVASRGGVVSMVIGALLVGVLARATRSKGGGQGLGISLVAGVAALAGVVMIALSSEGVQGELLDADVSKFELFSQALRMVPASPFFGAGRGAFESTFPAFRGAFSHMAAGYGTFAYPENVVAQWATEWGVPMAVAGFAAVAWALRPTAVLARSTNAAGAWAALVAVAVHNFGDFSSEVPGVMLALVGCVAIVVGGTVGKSPAWRIERWAVAPRGVALAGALGAVGGVALCAGGLRHELSADQRELQEAAIAHPVGKEQLEAMARAAMLRHPGEPYLPFIVAMREAQDRSGDAVAWIGATLDRASVYGPAHFLLARVLGARSPAQARLEYRTAMEQAPEFVDVVMKEAVGRVGGYWDAMELVPAGKLGERVLEEIVGRVADRLPSSIVRLDRDIAKRWPSVPGPWIRVAQGAVADVSIVDVAPWCQEHSWPACVQKALDSSEKAWRMEPGLCAGAALRAKARVAAGERKAAMSDLDGAVNTVSDRVGCMEELFALAQTIDDDATVERTLDKILHAGCSEPRECAERLIFVAQAEEKRGDLRRALANYKRANEQTPDDDGVLAHMARLAAACQLHAEALADYERLARRHPQEGQWRLAVEREQDAAMRETL